MASRTPARLQGSMNMRNRSANGRNAHEMDNARSLFALRPEAQIMQGDAQNSAGHRQAPDPLQGSLPDPNQQRNRRIFGKASVAFGMLDVVQYIHDVSSADTGGIIDAGVRMTGVLAKLRGALFAELLHVLFGAEVQTAGRARFNAGRF